MVVRSKSMVETEAAAARRKDNKMKPNKWPPQSYFGLIRIVRYHLILTASFLLSLFYHLFVAGLVSAHIVKNQRSCHTLCSCNMHVLSVCICVPLERDRPSSAITFDCHSTSLHPIAALSLHRSMYFSYCKNYVLSRSVSCNSNLFLRIDYGF